MNVGETVGIVAFVNDGPEVRFEYYSENCWPNLPDGGRHKTGYIHVHLEKNIYTSEGRVLDEYRNKQLLIIGEFVSMDRHRPKHACAKASATLYLNNQYIEVLNQTVSEPPLETEDSDELSQEGISPAIVDAPDFKIDSIAAKVIAPNLVFVGDDYKAEVFVAALTTTQNPVVKIGKVSKTEDGRFKIDGRFEQIQVDNGVGTYTVKAVREGLSRFEGLIEVKSPSGQMVSYPFESEYMVMKSSVVVSPTKMNVLYIGVNNPISIYIPGVHPYNVTATLTGGTLTNDDEAGKGNYIAKVTGGEEAFVTVSAKLGEDATSRPLATYRFRVKRVPDPEAYCAGQTGGLISMNKLVAGGGTYGDGVIAKMKDFDFDVTFRVTSFEVTMNVGSELISSKVNGNHFTESVKNQIKRLKSGSRVFIENIKAIGPDGLPRTLKPINFKIQ